MLKERKLWVSGVSATLITLFGVFCGFVPAALVAFPTYCTSIVTLSAAYFVGNVAARKVDASAPKAGG